MSPRTVFFVSTPMSGPLRTDPDRDLVLECQATAEEGFGGAFRRLYDLWRRGQESAEAPRPKVLMAVGDSISESWAFLSAGSFDCQVTRGEQVVAAGTLNVYRQPAGEAGEEGGTR